MQPLQAQRYFLRLCWTITKRCWTTVISSESSVWPGISLSVAPHLGHARSASSRAYSRSVTGSVSRGLGPWPERGVRACKSAGALASRCRRPGARTCPRHEGGQPIEPLPLRISTGPPNANTESWRVDPITRAIASTGRSLRGRVLRRERRGRNLASCTSVSRCRASPRRKSVTSRGKARTYKRPIARESPGPERRRCGGGVTQNRSAFGPRRQPR